MVRRTDGSENATPASAAPPPTWRPNRPVACIIMPRPLGRRRLVSRSFWCRSTISAASRRRGVEVLSRAGPPCRATSAAAAWRRWQCWLQCWDRAQVSELAESAARPPRRCRWLPYPLLSLPTTSTANSLLIQSRSAVVEASLLTGSDTFLLLPPCSRYRCFAHIAAGQPWPATAVCAVHP